MQTYSFISPIGNLHLLEKSGKLARLGFKTLTGCECGKQDDAPAPSALLREARLQLEEYFAGRLKKFSLPLAPEGTDFMQAVWKELERIPYGGTASYKQIAGRIGRPGAARAVGMANNKNPIAIIIPCHRVVGADGRLVGYAGGLDVKKALLALEGRPA